MKKLITTFALFCFALSLTQGLIPAPKKMGHKGWFCGLKLCLCQSQAKKPTKGKQCHLGHHGQVKKIKVPFGVPFFTTKSCPKKKAQLQPKVATSKDLPSLFVSTQFLSNSHVFINSSLEPHFRLMDLSLDHPPELQLLFRTIF